MMIDDDPQSAIGAALAKIRAGQQGTAPPDDIGAALAKLRAQQQQPQIRHDPALRARQAARGKISDQEQGDAAAAEAQPGVLGALADAAQGIPGVGALEAGARSLVRQQPYREAYRDITNQTNKVPSSAKAIGRAAAAIPLVAGGSASTVLGRAVPAFLPASAVSSGALIGGATEALDANPDKGIIGRAVTGAAGAAAGGLLGKGLELGETAIRAFGAANPAREMLARQAARAGSARNLYSKALAEGQGQTATPAVQKFLAEPDIAEIVDELRQTRPFQGVAPEAPEMLDAVYKTLSDRAGVVRKGLESVAPSRPNIGRFRGADIKSAQQDALGAMDGPMPSYRDAVTDYATQTRGMDAYRHGYDAQRMATGGNLPTGRNLTRTTPEALGEWAAGANQATRGDAAAGALGSAKLSGSKHLLGMDRKALSTTPNTLRSVLDPVQAKQDLLNKLILAFGANYAP